MTHAENHDNEIVRLETAYWEAMQRKDGAATADLSGEPSLVTGTGGVMTIPRDRMAGMTRAGDWTINAFTIEEVRVIRPAQDVAVIAYKVRQNVTRDGQTTDMLAADSSTWVRTGDTWQCWAHSETLLDQPA